MNTTDNLLPGDLSHLRIQRNMTRLIINTALQILARLSVNSQRNS